MKIYTTTDPVTQLVELCCQEDSMCVLHAAIFRRKQTPPKAVADVHRRTAAPRRD